MGDRLITLVQSLGFRLLVPLSLVVGLVLAIHAMTSFGSTKEDYLRFVRADVDRTSRLVMRATHDGMLLNRKEEVQATIQRLAEGGEMAAIRVYDKDGAIRMSARREEIGRRIGIGSETCHSCHRQGETKGDAVLERKSLERIGEGAEVLRHLSVIANEPSCATAPCHAHPPEKRVLGVLDLEMSMAPLEAALRTARRQMLWTTLILILVIGVVAAVVLRGVVLRPVLKLNDGTRRIADGDLETRVEVRGRHELAQLATAFNKMAGDLNAARRELTVWSQNLEDKVVEKTEELSRAQRQVLHMEKMASLGKLAATVAHELNNPLSGVLTYARLVRRELTDQPLAAELRDELSRYLGLIERECSRCGSIVQSLLLFARRSGAELAPTDLNEVVERSLMLVRHHLEISGIRLNCERLSGDSTILADAGQLQQALVALLVNAVEAMQGNRGEDAKLSVRLKGTDQEVQIEVADTGVGIPPEVLPQIFEPFYSTKEVENGVGLGLSVVYGIVDRHGGRIDVQSQVGQGTVFRVRLPRRAAVKDGAPRAAASPAGSSM
jgi:two-component system NtrC family sensor kinase